MLSKEGLYKKNPKYREKVDSIIYNKTLESFDFTVRLHNIFKSNNIITVNDLLKYSPTDFLKFQNSGLKTQKEVLDFLNSHNLSFGDQWEKNLQELDEDEYIQIKDDEIQFLVSSPFQNSFFSTRTINYLKRMKIEYNRDILFLNKENIMLTKNAGRKTYVEIRDFIKKNNFNFGDNIYGWTSENIEKIKEEFNNKIIENYNLRIKK